MFKKFIILSTILLLNTEIDYCMDQNASSEIRSSVHRLQNTVGFAAGVCANISNNHWLSTNAAGLSLLGLFHRQSVYEAGKERERCVNTRDWNTCYNELTNGATARLGTAFAVGALVTTLIRIGLTQLFKTPQEPKREIINKEVETPGTPTQQATSEEVTAHDMPIQSTHLGRHLYRLCFPSPF